MKRTIRELLMLFTSWRNESDLFKFGSVKQGYENYKQKLDMQISLNILHGQSTRHPTTILTWPSWCALSLHFFCALLPFLRRPYIALAPSLHCAAPTLHCACALLTVLRPPYIALFLPLRRPYKMEGLLWIWLSLMSRDSPC